MNINVHIERLILDGLPVHRTQAPLVQAAVEAELARLLTTGGMSGDLAAGGAVPTVSAGSMNISTESQPASLGNQIAQAVYGGISK